LDISRCGLAGFMWVIFIARGIVVFV
jgi:hypothetical protein